MPNNNSILDRVLETQIKQDQAQFNPEYIVNRILQSLSPRDRDIVKMRHGLNQDNISRTLEEIGKSHHITRERVRQIESSSVKQIRNDIKNLPDYSKIINVVDKILRQQGGVIGEKQLVKKIKNIVPDDLSDNMVVFFLNLIQDNFLLIKESSEIEASWQVVDFDSNILMQILEAVKGIFLQENKIMSFSDLWSRVKSTEVYKKYSDHIDEDAFLSFISISKKIQSNPFGDWGLSKWNLINPKRMNDKIYLLLKHHGQPLHFREIAKNINKIKFDGKKAHPATIHNELIMNSDRYVLIGRGIYALKEWGYKPGVVADVITEILQQASGPVHKKEIIEKVLEKRMVKDTTVILALTNRKRFKKLPGGNYTLADN